MHSSRQSGASGQSNIRMYWEQALYLGTACRDVLRSTTWVPVAGGTAKYRSIRGFWLDVPESRPDTHQSRSKGVQGWCCGESQSQRQGMQTHSIALACHCHGGIWEQICRERQQNGIDGDAYWNDHRDVCPPPWESAAGALIRWLTFIVRR